MTKKTIHSYVRGLLLGASLFASVAGGALTARAQVGAGAVEMQENDTELRRDVARLDSHLSARDLDSLEADVERSSAKWRKRDRQSFVAYMRKAAGLLSSHRIGDQSRQSMLLARHAISVLEGGDLSIQEHVQFVEFLTQEPREADEPTWRKLREQKARLWLAAWRRLAESVDPKFDFDDRPVMNVLPPAATGLPAGVSPAGIKDPKLRAEYEEAVAKNAARMKLYNDQYWLKLNAAAFFKEAERYLVNAYARPPADTPELERLLPEYLNDADTRNRIVEAVRQRAQD